jgi:ubiquinol-cytochrome c reductase cytochrome b subunit
MFNLMALYPSIEAWATKDKAYHNLLQRPRDVPVRTGLGVMALTFYGVLFVGGQNDILARTFDWSLQATSWTLRVLLFLLPPLAFYITKRICLGLQHHDEELLHHGIETGIIRRLPSGEYIEVTAPLPKERASVLAMQLGIEHHNGHGALPLANGHVDPVNTVEGAGRGHARGEAPISRPVSPLARARASLENFFFERHEPPRANPEDEEPKTLTSP